MVLAHEAFMQHAIRVARQNPSAPFGTILVDAASNEIVVEGINQTHLNCVMHGEMDVIHRYVDHGAERCVGGICDSTTTAKPCCMCQAAILWTGIPEVFFGASIRRLIDLGWNQVDISAAKVVESASFARCNVTGGVLETECDELFEQAKA